jgi:Arc/MetJ family transcription regulator
MKTTIEIDEAKLVRLMALTGLKTRKEAVDWALTEAERIASINRIAETPWDAETAKNAIDPGYDILAIRRSTATYKAKGQ